MRWRPRWPCTAVLCTQLQVVGLCSFSPHELLGSAWHKLQKELCKDVSFNGMPGTRPSRTLARPPGVQELPKACRGCCQHLLAPGTSAPGALPRPRGHCGHWLPEAPAWGVPGGTGRTRGGTVLGVLPFRDSGFPVNSLPSVASLHSV